MSSLACAEKRSALRLVMVGWLMGAFACLGQQPESSHQPMSADEIAAQLHEHNVQRDAELLRYVSRRTMTVEYKAMVGSKRASEEVEMTYTAPGTKQFKVLSTSGSGLLAENVFQREIEDEQAAADPKQREASALLPEHYNLRLAGTDHLPEGDCYVLDVTPKGKSRFLFSGRVWVQSKEFAVVKIQAAPQETPSFLVRDGAFTATFGKVGEFWLPRETVSTSRIFMGGRATFSIQFGPYRILEVRPVTPKPEHP